jgi:hypothetical protein
MTREELRLWFALHGWQRDAWGHYKKEMSSGTVYRMKFSKRVLRYERRRSDGVWMKVRSGYYSNLSLTDEGKLAGMA